eukprot:14144-Chlamydomonas_euryale.AAC.6
MRRSQDHMVSPCQIRPLWEGSASSGSGTAHDQLTRPVGSACLAHDLMDWHAWLMTCWIGMPGS